MTTTYALTQAVADTLVARLVSDLPAQIAAINAEANSQADGYLLKTPVAILDHVPSDGDLQAGFPQVGIQDFPTTIKDDIGTSFTGQYTLGVIVWDQHPETQGLARLMRRWERAAASALLRGRSIAPNVFGLVLVDVIPGPTLDHPTDPDNPDSGPKTWVSFRCVRVRCSTDES